MNPRSPLLYPLLLVSFLVGATQADTVGAQALDRDTEAKLKAALAGDHRVPRNAARDAFRNPAETLAFFGLRDDMTVMEIWPGGGWYSELLAPVLRENGKYYAAHWPADSSRSYVPAALQRYADKLAAAPAVYDAVAVTHIGAGSWEPVEAGSVDLVLSFRNVHSWMGDDITEPMFQAFFRALKPGGVLGVVQHRGKPDGEQHPQGRTGYVKQALVIEMAQAAGFELAGSSEINANPKDTRDHPEGVWTLPPSARLDDTPDGPKYRAIGESDRMTLKFVKPGAS